ncbi:MAG: hypothetical protein NC201_06050 [Prevotella sp.]|nr:hypothetical protein [Bacteroides sp.]MCM1366793.1 hypothetical protein [Prevotella sp.]MCM1437467.1 hypothetical protein [Prevotella sp.]
MNKNIDYAEDFESWAADCVTVMDKMSGLSVPFLLNAPQKRVLACMEEQRRSGKPIRLILLKARQWGGSTLVQVYMAWMQLVRHRGWNSVICAHVKDASANIRGMYSRLLREYPEQLKTGKGKDWVLSPYEKSQSVMEISARDCRVTLATAGAPNSVRGSNYQMAHLSEVAYWGEGDSDRSEEIIRTVCGSVPRAKDTIIVMESTANGKGNYFYDEWQRAVAGKSDKLAVFVPWYEIEIYRREVSEEERDDLIDSFDDYETELYKSGVTLESIAWYHDKRKEYPTHEAMMAEFPSTADEAFSASGIFDYFTEDSMPHIIESIIESDDNAINVLVTISSSDPARRVLQTFRVSESSIIATNQLNSEGSGPQLARRIEKWSRENDGSVALITSGTASDSGHAKWLLKRLTDADIDVIRNEDDEAIIKLDSESLAELIDLHHYMYDKLLIADMNKDICTEYRDFRIDNPAKSPGVLSRLAILGLYEFI